MRATLINSPHMGALSTVLRLSVGSREWQAEHPDGTFWHAWERVLGVCQEHAIHQSQVEALVCDVCEVFAGIVGSDPRLALYTANDLGWLVTAIQERDHLALVMTCLGAYTVPKDDYLTPAEVAEMTGTSASGWRNKAAAGQMGAIKKGKQWLLSRSVLTLMAVIPD